MDNRINVLITGAGAPGTAGTIYSLKKNPGNIKFKIITTDIKDNTAGKFMSDSFYQLPPAPQQSKPTEAKQNYGRRFGDEFYPHTVST